MAEHLWVLIGTFGTLDIFLILVAAAAVLATWMWFISAEYQAGRPPLTRAQEAELELDPTWIAAKENINFPRLSPEIEVPLEVQEIDSAYCQSMEYENLQMPVS